MEAVLRKQIPRVQPAKGLAKFFKEIISYLKGEESKGTFLENIRTIIESELNQFTVDPDNGKSKKSGSRRYSGPNAPVKSLLLWLLLEKIYHTPIESADLILAEIIESTIDRLKSGDKDWWGHFMLRAGDFEANKKFEYFFKSIPAGERMSPSDLLKEIRELSPLRDVILLSNYFESAFDREWLLHFAKQAGDLSPATRESECYTMVRIRIEEVKCIPKLLFETENDGD